MDYCNFLERVRNKLLNLVTVRDIFFFTLGVAAAFYLAFNIYQWRLGEAKKTGEIVFQNTPYVFKQAQTQR